MKESLPLVIASLLALFPSRAASEPPALAVNASACVIVVPARTNAIVDYAVQELQLHLKLVSGADVPWVTEAKPGQFPFFVGIPPAGDGKPLAAEEARWEISPLCPFHERGSPRGEESQPGRQDGLLRL